MQIFVLGQPLVLLSNCPSLLNLLVKKPETFFKSPNLKRRRRPGILTKALAGMFSLVAVLGLFACPAFAQNTSSSISGTVVDASGPQYRMRASRCITMPPGRHCRQRPMRVVPILLPIFSPVHIQSRQQLQAFSL